MTKRMKLLAVTMAVLVWTQTAQYAEAQDRALRRQVREAVAELLPDATSAQQRTYGILLPTVVSPEKHTVILVHGLYGEVSAWDSMRNLLTADGYQVATFAYPSDQPLDDSAKFFRQQMRELAKSYPGLPVSIIAHSQGGLVIRAAIEPDAGKDIQIERLILLGTPNEGTRWAPAGFLLKIQSHYDQWRHSTNWQPSWAVTDGLGEALSDLAPGSEFIRRLDMCARRPDVKYTLIAGNRNPTYVVAADITDTAVVAASATREFSHTATRKTLNTWSRLKAAVTGDEYMELKPGEQPSLSGGHAKQWLSDASSFAGSLRGKKASSDGPVSVNSARLEGVDDLVILPATHSELWTGDCPVSWKTIHERLAGVTAR